MHAVGYCQFLLVQEFYVLQTCFRGSVNFIRFGSILHGSHLDIAWGIAYYYQIVQVIKLKEMAILGTNFAIADHALNFTLRPGHRTEVFTRSLCFTISWYPS